MKDTSRMEKDGEKGCKIKKRSTEGDSLGD